MRAAAFGVTLLLVAAFLGAGCAGGVSEPRPSWPPPPPPDPPPDTTPVEAPAPGSLAEVAASGGGRAAERAAMVRDQLARRGVSDARVLAAMARVPRHRFMPRRWRGKAYEDGAQPIGYGQTISQPYVVGLMTELLDVEPGDRVLEIGTGSGYHAAVLAVLAAEVYSIEILGPLAERARDTLAELGFDNVHVRMGDGYRGWPSVAPFDAILLTAAPSQIPKPLLEQLAPGGRLVAPVGEGSQELTRITRTESGFEEERVATVFFVPMTGKAAGETPPP